MAESDESDDHRLAGRTPRSSRPGPPPDSRTTPGPDLDDAGGDDADDQIDAVTRLMGFLRSTD
jgi:hypothetical protein